MQKTANHFKLKPGPKPLHSGTEITSPKTEEISSKMTSPTLVEFRNRNSHLPEWRLQLQNVVQQRLRSNREESQEEAKAPTAVPDPGEVQQERAEHVTEQPDASVRRQIDNKFLANALKRIESSRNKYLIPETAPETGGEDKKLSKKDYPFSIAARTENPTAEVAEPETEGKAPPKPKLVGRKDPRPVKGFYDTSELDPQFVPAKVSTSFDTLPVHQPAEAPDRRGEENPAVPPSKGSENLESSADEATKETERNSIEEFDDYAPFGLRFNAGLFDLLIGGFLSFVLLLPFIVAGGSWFTFAGLAAFVATCSIVMFIYLTVSTGLVGKSFGMHLFSLEMIDIGGESYPSFHQSAVSASVYLLSLAFFGIGFVTALFDDDRRAFHDLVSGTLVVREV